ncbi:hypothetical protein IU470_26855 [Nocardia abscessus]|uniref:Uncharacterized protein n=1 Tax=Nocardia abscessus TaxID=120957 RepID=A0ABS0CFS2_9NOCA|nr:hypothetical protein [Nocardia abscessus]MBF6228710.1 hypothetical protein [Nocardia abscessus]
MSGAEDTLEHGEEFGVPVTRSGDVSALPDIESEVRAYPENVGVFRFRDRQLQRQQLVEHRDREPIVAAICDPVRELHSPGECFAVVWAEYSRAVLDQLGEHRPRRVRITGIAGPACEPGPRGYPMDVVRRQRLLERHQPGPPRGSVVDRTASGIRAVEEFHRTSGSSAPEEVTRRRRLRIGVYVGPGQLRQRGRENRMGVEQGSWTVRGSGGVK